MRIKSYQLFENNNIDIFEYLLDLSVDICDRYNCQLDKRMSNDKRYIFRGEFIYIEIIKQGKFYTFSTICSKYISWCEELKTKMEGIFSKVKSIAPNSEYYDTLINGLS